MYMIVHSQRMKKTHKCKKISKPIYADTLFGFFLHYIADVIRCDTKDSLYCNTG